MPKASETRASPLQSMPELDPQPPSPSDQDTTMAEAAETRASPLQYMNDLECAMPELDLLPSSSGDEAATIPESADTRGSPLSFMDDLARSRPELDSQHPSPGDEATTKPEVAQTRASPLHSNDDLAGALPEHDSQSPSTGNTLYYDHNLKYILIESLQESDLGRKLLMHVELKARASGYVDIVAYVMDHIDGHGIGYFGFVSFLYEEANQISFYEVGYDDLPNLLNSLADELFDEFVAVYMGAQSEDEKDTLQPVPFDGLKKVLIKAEEKGSSTCVVCLEEFEVGKESTALECSHKFHEECLVEWLAKKNSCPICRFELRPVSIS